MIKDRKYYEEEATYEEWYKWYQTIEKKQYPYVYLTVDNIVLKWNDKTNKIEILMIKRKQHPYKDKYALVGGFVNPDENTTEAVIRETKEETNLELNISNIQQIGTFSDVNRDPRHRVITVVHIVYLPFFKNKYNIKTGSDALDVEWIELTKILERENLNNLAFDHKEIIETAILRIKNQMSYNPNILKILPKEFKISTFKKLFSQLDNYYEKMPQNNFFRNFKKFLIETEQFSQGKKGRTARLFKLNEEILK